MKYNHYQELNFLYNRDVQTMILDISHQHKYPITLSIDYLSNSCLQRGQQEIILSH